MLDLKASSKYKVLTARIIGPRSLGLVRFVRSSTAAALTA
jgi:hypothetical protein